jgi:glycerophosphoryl diester phosphodiesterase
MFARCSLLWALAAFLAWGAVGAGHAQVTVEARLSSDPQPLIAAFRSVGSGYPESSLAGIRYGLDRGVDLLELHVQITADGHHVVFHDAYLNRMTNVETVFPDGPEAGPGRAARGGRDYLADYTLDEIRQLRLLVDGEPGMHLVPTLAEALDLIAGRRLTLLSLQDFDIDALVEELANRQTGHLMVSSIDPGTVAEVAEATGLPVFASIRRSRVFDTDDNLAILQATSALLGDSLVVAHVNSTRLLTPELLDRVSELGVRVSVSGMGREDFALEDQADPGPWRAALSSGATVLWTTHPDEVLALLGR